MTEQLEQQLQECEARCRQLTAYIRQLEESNHKLEAELTDVKEMESRFRQIAENVTEVFFLISSHTDEILYISPTYEKVWGRTCESLYQNPQSWLTAIHPDDCWQAMASLETQFRTGDEFEEEYRIIRPDGSICWVWVRAFPVRGDDDQVDRFVAIAEDVSKRKEAEEALRKSEEQFRLTFERAPIGMAISTIDGQFTRVNQALCDALGYSQEQLLNLTFADITHPEDLELSNTLEHQLMIGSSDDFQMEKRYQASDGRIVDTIHKVVIVRDEAGRPLHFNSQIVDITERKQMERQLLYDAFHDGLTKLPNRALFMDRLQQAIKRKARDPDYIFAVLFLDLDRFKVVNDSAGHLVGDQLLVAIARRLEQCLRPADTVARLGGDEFTILIENMRDQEESITVAERIYQELSLPFKIENQEIFTSASIGIAFSSDHYGQPEDMLRDADITMYRAKEGGRGRYEIFDQSMRTRAVERLKLETDLRRALEREEFEVYYQPITSLITGLLSGFEALVRWRHPDRGLVSPLDFIPIAEETGLIIPLGAWILRQACQQLRQWHDLFVEHPRLKMSVNLSAKQFRDPHLLDTIDQIIAETGVDHHQLKLEITESILIDNIETTTEILRQLRARDIELSLDDFGTGYSSLSYLHRFPVNTVKIDRSFINDMGQDDEHSEIVRAIISLAHILHMDVVAEGIETTDQLSNLKSWTCEQGQGYLFSKPLTASDAEELIMRSPRW